MVHLDKIYTKSGDRGKTSLGNGERVAKTCLRISAYGLTDETGAAIGLAAACAEGPMLDALRRVQNDLFDVGADLCVPQPPDEKEGAALRVTDVQVERLEAEIDANNDGLGALKSFILSGGTELAARLHVARCVARRCELTATTLAEASEEVVSPPVLRYLNRLSDWLFVLARRANHDAGESDVLWLPGGER